PDTAAKIQAFVTAARALADDAEKEADRRNAALAAATPVAKVDYPGMPHPTQESLAAARKMVQRTGGGSTPLLTPEQHEIMSTELAAELDKVPDMRDAMAARWKVRLSGRGDMKPGDPLNERAAEALGLTGQFGEDSEGWNGSWEIHIAQRLMTEPSTMKTQLKQMIAEGYAIRTPQDARHGGKYSVLRYAIAHEFGHALFDEGTVTA